MRSVPRAHGVSLLLGRMPALPFALLGAIAVGLFVIWLAMDPPQGELPQIAGLLSASALVSFLAYFAILRYLRRRPLAGMGGRIVLAALFGVLLALVNVIITAGFMFLSGHDLTLLAALLLFSLLVASLIAGQVARAASDSISRLVQTVDQVRTDTVAVRAATDGHDEVAHLARAFNAMAERLSAATAARTRAEAQRRELVAAISHDLRTPLASARLMSEAIADQLLDEDTQRRYLIQIGAELERLDRLIEDLFDLSRIEAGALALQRTPTDVGVLVAESVESVRAEADHDAVQLHSEVGPDLPLVQADPWCMQRALRNLLSNAIRYSPAGGRVTLAARRLDGGLELTVADSGPGIPAADAARVFDPFFRGDVARRRDGAGAGLGLAIARGIFEAHDGTLVLDEDGGSGCRFRARIPLQ